ncbi:MAG: hypothetical protein FWC32_10975 [Firmicutes bacterium]|nr:hypothetical protein [Bacillota bacterium]
MKKVLYVIVCIIFYLLFFPLPLVKRKELEEPDRHDDFYKFVLKATR